MTKDDVLQTAALAAKWKEPPRDALDTLVLLNSGLDLGTLDKYEQVGCVACGWVLGLGVEGACSSRWWRVLEVSWVEVWG